MFISYSNIAKSIDFYEKAGYKRIESPWLISNAIHNITKPLNATTYQVKKDCSPKEKVFVASGEQSFLYLINKGNLPSSGKFQTVTPCIRDDVFDETHTKYFIKNELIIYDVNKVADVTYELERMMRVASTFFKTLDNSEYYDVVKTDIGYDINFKGIEIGSYGIRTSSICHWIYGTGLAEPRFSTISRDLFTLEEY